MPMQETLDWTGCAIVRKESGKMGGRPNVDGNRIWPETFVEYWNNGESIDEILYNFGVTWLQVTTILSFADQKGYLTRPFIL